MVHVLKPDDELVTRLMRPSVVTHVLKSNRLRFLKVVHFDHLGLVRLQS